ncbi:MAG: nucleoside monophosphate kinase [Patescibacteria group bacterium]|jgi:adenylate kinase family enzyme
MRRHKALLVVGPTGSGKSPLGKLIQEQGFGGRRCCHFDFGDQLRTAQKQPDVMPFLDAHDHEVIGQVFAASRLLADDEFPVAGKILRHYLESAVGADDWVVLNGLPRNVFQARMVESFATIKLVVVLECSPDDVAARIALDAHDERRGRDDNTPAAIAERLRIYYQQTLPLIQHYRAGQVRIIEFAVVPETTPEQIWQVLNAIRLD